jgi:hypothetical protein
MIDDVPVPDMPVSRTLFIEGLVLDPHGWSRKSALPAQSSGLLLMSPRISSHRAQVLTRKTQEAKECASHGGLTPAPATLVFPTPFRSHRP